MEVDIALFILRYSQKPLLRVKVWLVRKFILVYVLGNYRDSASEHP